MSNFINEGGFGGEGGEVKELIYKTA